MGIVVNALLILASLVISAAMIYIASRHIWGAVMNDWHLTVPGLLFPLLVIIATAGTYSRYPAATWIDGSIAGLAYAICWGLFFRARTLGEAQFRGRQTPSDQRTQDR
jgi:hypothetical protein